MPKHDAIIIGTGQAGPSLAGRLAEAGMDVAIIERKFYGGTCVNTGCIPTKTLVASAYAAHLARRAADYGVTIGGAISVDMRAVKARKDEISGKSKRGLEDYLKNLKGCTVYEDHARFISPKEVMAGGQVLSAEKIFINVGGRALVPNIPGLDHIHYLTNSSMMDIDFLPRHLIVIGGSYIGLEFAQIYRRFGSEVTVIELAPRLIAREDEDVSEAVTSILRAEGITVRTGAECLSAAKEGEEISVRLSCPETPDKVTGSHLLLAVGRRPNTDDLELCKAGIAVDAKGYIEVDDLLQTNVPGVWALGDCNGRGAFTHTSYNDFEIAAANVLDNEQRRVTDRIMAYNLYIDPPLGRAGMTEAEVRASGRPALIATMPMERVGRAVEKGETQGFMKILVDTETKLILGASLLGAGGDEVIHTILDLMYAKAPYTVMQKAMHIHPTVSELLPTMLNDLKPLQ
ncbi:MAG: FAD-containing oxidoreductase [Beijerinckiaceae bacterium]|nr:FAD-containing oxidoreductase [Beijerinckiaceae bacterium]